MKVFRFMSKEEFIKLMHGDTLTNNTDYAKKGHKTGTVGFGFLSKEEYKPEYAWHFLRGIAQYDYLVEFEVPSAYNFKRSKGTYAKPVEVNENGEATNADIFTLMSHFRQTMEVNELSTTQYSTKEFKILRYCKLGLLSNEDKWKWKKGKEEI